MTPEQWDEVACRYGTDKGSWHHNYMPHYHALLSGRPVRRLLEIGVSGGRSMKMWRELLPDSFIVGIDTDESCLLHQSERAPVVLADARDRGQLKAVSTLYGPFDVVVDDGSHELAQIVSAFEALVPIMASGGLYVVEDTLASDPAVATFVRKYRGRSIVPDTAPKLHDAPSGLLVFENLR